MKEKLSKDIIRHVTVADSATVTALGKEAFSKFFEKRHFFSELGVVEPLTKSASREEFLRFVRVNIEEAHFVFKHFKWEEDGSLSAVMQNYNPIRSERVASRLGDEEFPFLIVPRVLKKFKKLSPPTVEVITFDICWK